LGERERQSSEHHKVSVTPNAFKAAHPQEREAVVVLQAAEFALAAERPR
jgi:hypothetical protein